MDLARQTMTITLELPPETERKLRYRASATGKDVATLVREAVEEKLRSELPSFDEIFAPIREAVQESGMTEAELDAFFERAIAEVREERRRPLPGLNRS